MYVWEYDGGSPGKAETYAGPAGLTKTNERAVRLLLDHETRARVALDRRIEKYRAALARFGSR